MWADEKGWNRMLLRSLVCLVLAVTSTSALAEKKQKFQYLGRYSITSRDSSIIHNAVISVLRDPESARFGIQAGAKQADGTVIVCGEVNARNSFGGYTGMKPYLVVYSPSLMMGRVAALGGTDSEDTGVVLTCKKAFGIKVPWWAR
jgi:hypothetical protein